MIRFLGKSISVALLLFVAFLLNTNIILAQGVPSPSDSSVSLNMSPSNPNPNENVALSLSSNSVDLDNSTIYWYVDGVMRKEGTGEKVLNTQTGGSGKITSIRTTITTPDGTNIEKTLSINPTQVDLIVEASSYVPPFYKGTAYFVSQGSAKIIAIPNIIENGQKVGTNNLNFKWTKNGIVLGDSSGMGKNTLTVSGSVPIDDIQIELEVSDMSGNSLADQSTIIAPSDPKIIFYENSPLYGMLFNNAINRNYLLGNREELNVVAEPFFFDLKGATGDDSTYSWLVNGNSVNTTGKKNELLLKQTGGIKGVASISLQVENIARIFQYAGNDFNVTFGE